VQAAYTWSRAFITNPFGVNVRPVSVHPYEPNITIVERMVLNYVWNLPFGHPRARYGT